MSSDDVFSLKGFSLINEKPLCFRRLLNMLRAAEVKVTSPIWLWACSILYMTVRIMLYRLMKETRRIRRLS